MSSPETADISPPGEAYKIRHHFSHFKWEQLVAGITSGGLVAAILHPLELAKIRLQVNEGCGLVKVR